MSIAGKTKPPAKKKKAVRYKIEVEYIDDLNEWGETVHDILQKLNGTASARIVDVEVIEVEVPSDSDGRGEW